MFRLYITCDDCKAQLIPGFAVAPGDCAPFREAVSRSVMRGWFFNYGNRVSRCPRCAREPGRKSTPLQETPGRKQ